MKRMVYTVAISVFSVAAALSFAVDACAVTSDEQQLVDEAVITLNSFQTTEDMGWFRDMLPDAEGVLIVPDMFKAGLLIGGSGGKGVLLVRDEKTGAWIGPAFYNLGSLTGGLQIGVQISEVVILVMNRDGVESLYSSSVKLGSDVSVAAGPVGAGTAGSVSLPTATFVSFIRSKGAYAGLTLEGAVLDVDEDANASYYGKPVRVTDILLERSISSPGASKLRSDVSSYAARKKK